MRKLNIVMGSLLVIAVVAYLAILLVVENKFRAPDPSAAPSTMTFHPPRPDDAPPPIRDAVLLGYDIMLDTGSYAKPYVGNKLTCSNCHFRGGLVQQGIPLVGVAATYPKFRSRTRYATDLVARTAECFERSMNGQAPPPDSHEMQALQAYYAWISREMPIYSNVAWLGVKIVRPEREPDRVAGEAIFNSRCASCHGSDGQGTDQAPPLWGPQSFNDGAGMAKPPMLGSFVFANMPKGSADLSVEQAYDVAAFVASKPRPHFAKAQ